MPPTLATDWLRMLDVSMKNGQVIRQPSLFIAAASDDVLKFPSSEPQIEYFRKTLPGLRGCHILEGAGRWIQRERAPAVNSLLIDFLARQ